MSTTDKSPTSTSTAAAAILFFLLASSAAAQDPETEDRYSPPAATIVIVLIGVLFVFTGFLSVYLRHYAAACFGIQQGSGSGGWNRPVQRGLDPAVIQTFPVYLYSDVSVHRKDKVALECAVCLNEFENHEVLRLLPVCNHVFHPHCVDPWLVTRGTCPVCRANFEKVTGCSEINDSTAAAARSPLAHQNSAGIESDHTSNQSRQRDHHHIVDVERSPEIRRSPTPDTMNQSRQPRGALALREKIIGRFPRSHSTGHSLFRLGDDWDKFTLRLPEEAHSKLVNLNLDRKTSTGGEPLSPVNSPKSGFRPTRSVAAGSYYERWGFTMTPPFISRGRSRMEVSDSEEWNQTTTADTARGGAGGFLKSFSPLFDRVRAGGVRPGGNGNDVGERSSDRLRPPSSSCEIIRIYFLFLRCLICSSSVSF